MPIILAALKPKQNRANLSKQLNGPSETLNVSARYFLYKPSDLIGTIEVAVAHKLREQVIIHLFPAKSACRIDNSHLFAVSPRWARKFSRSTCTVE